jgi:Zn-dependent peptidase ImmA (M78 family)
MKKGTSNKRLREIFEILNERFFENKIPMRLTVRFATDKEVEKSDGTHRDGRGMYRPGEIFIHRNLRTHPDLATIVLIHEMAHAVLHEEGYIGYKQDGGHSIRFHAEIDRLYKAGIFEGLL